MPKRHVLITGPPGVGKTTLVKKLSNELVSSGLELVGFYTEEVREGSRRIGFDLVGLDGQLRAPLARNNVPSEGVRRPKVGSYQVFVPEFEHLALELLNQYIPDGKSVLVVDEIGKMELFSKSFVNEVTNWFLNDQSRLICTVPSKGPPLVEALKKRPDVELFEITKDNRDSILNSMISVFR